MSQACVNALCRAILISTLPSQNRLFKPLCGLVFARNFQSCLIINYNKGQKWAEGKLFFEYNFEAISIVWLYLQTAAFSTPCPDIDWGIKLGLITSSWQIFIIAGDNPEEIRYYMCWLSNVRLDWDSWSNTTDLRTYRREFRNYDLPWMLHSARHPSWFHYNGGFPANIGLRNYIPIVSEGISFRQKRSAKCCRFLLTRSRTSWIAKAGAWQAPKLEWIWMHTGPGSTSGWKISKIIVIIHLQGFQIICGGCAETYYPRCHSFWILMSWVSVSKPLKIH